MKSLDPFCPRSFQLSRMILGRSPTLIVMAFHMSTPSPFGARPPGLGECNHVRFVCLMQVRYAPSGYTSTIYIILNHIMMYLLYIQIMMMNDLTNYIWFLLFHSIKVYLYLLRVVFFHCNFLNPLQTAKKETAAPMADQISLSGCRHSFHTISVHCFMSPSKGKGSWKIIAKKTWA